MLRRQNSVAETKIFTKILQYTRRRDLSLRRMAATGRCNLAKTCPPIFNGKMKKTLSALRGGSVSNVVNN